MTTGTVGQVSERLFLAIWPPAHVLDALDTALPRHLDALRWQPRQRWHITVAFLGDREPARVMRRFERLDLPAADQVRLAGAGTFGPVLWVGVETGPWLAGLAAQARRTFGVDERRFRGHVTVARARDRVGQHALNRARTALAGFESPWWLPDSLTLVRSLVGPRPEYEVIGLSPFPTA
jgi:2'-5' RNA ligase